LFIIVIAILKPLQYHQKRKNSTAGLKITYLIYLAIVLIFTYRFIFHQGHSKFNLQDPDDPRAILHFSLVLIGFFIPNLGILLRRKIKERTIYNIAMSIVNVIITLYLLFLILKVV
jgi:hypothetical protein